MCTEKEFELKWYEYIWFTITDFIHDFIYPAYKIQNMFKNRYDLVKLSKFKSYEYIEVSDRLFEANMELIKFFMEKSNPEKYVLWYKDENGNDVGHKYGDYKDIDIIYPNLKNKWIMDIIKEIYKWYTVIYNELQDDSAYILEVWNKYFIKMWFEDSDEIDKETHEPYSIIKSSVHTYTEDELKKLDINWNRILKYTDSKSIIEIGNERTIHDLRNEIEKRIFKEKQYYLHLCVEVCPYLWI